MPGVGTTHHVQLAGHFYLVKPGSYQKRVAPQFGSRFSTGDPDYNNFSMWQHWVQRCFVGGMDAEEWADDAMYDDGAGVNTSEHERVTLARDLMRGAGANWAVGSGVGALDGYLAVVYNNKLYVVTRATAVGASSNVWEYDPVTDGWVLKASPGMGVRSVAAFDGKLYLGGRTTDQTAALLKSGSGTLGSWTTVTNPAGVGSFPVDAMRAFQQKLYVAYGVLVWRLKDDQAWDGSTVFYKANANSDTNDVVAMETHLGFLYMLSQNGHVHRTDGNTTFDIWSWDGQTIGVDLRSFDGRLFIATEESSGTSMTEGNYGVLYQMSGSAVTQLKRWGRAGEVAGIRRLRVFDRRLFYGASNLLGVQAGFGVAVYDSVEDAHSIYATNKDGVTYARGAAPFWNYSVDEVIYFGGKIFAFVRGHGAFFTRYGYRDRLRLEGTYDTSAAGAQPGDLNGGWFTSSAYDAGLPGVKKLWRKVVVDFALPVVATSITVAYSLDNGTSWTALASLTTGSSQPRTRAEFFLENRISVSLKLRITLRSTSATRTPVFYGWAVSYVPVPEPNWLWTFTIVLSEKQALLDGTTATVDTEAELTYLKTTYRAKQLVTFVDAEGDVWATGGVLPGVLIYDMTVWLPDLVQPLEGEVQLTLLEAVETY